MVEENKQREMIRGPWDNLTSWVGPLSAPKESFDLVFRLGQKTERYFETKVEHFAPYLLKDGLVLRITKYRNNLNIDELRVISRYRNRVDKLEQREVYNNQGRVIERFGKGREDKLAEIVTESKIGDEDTVKTYTFYHKYRQDGLFKREVTEWELQDIYLHREDYLTNIKEE